MMAILGCSPPSAAVILAADWRTFSVWVGETVHAAKLRVMGSADNIQQRR